MNCDGLKTRSTNKKRMDVEKRTIKNIETKEIHGLKDCLKMYKNDD